MINKYIKFALLLFALLVSNTSLAVGKLGHQVVCELAFTHLSLEKQEKITTLLASIPEPDQQLINHYNYRKPNQTVSFADACTWADAIKRVESYRSFSAWHYMNVPRNHKKININDCKANCLPQAILQHQQLLIANKNKINWERIQALLFLGHWLGDIHQPLHISFADDLGGNKVKFSHLETKCNNLHSYWDECILYRGKSSKKKWLALLEKQWTTNSQPKWQTEQVWQWADESFQLAKAASFNYCQEDGQGNCQKPNNKIKLPPDYLTQYQPVMEQRLLHAAQRLTKVLEASL